MELEEDEPFPPERTTGRPRRRRNRTPSRSADGGIETGVPEVDAGRCRANFGGNGELIRVITGEVHCSGDDGNHFSLRAGDWETIPLAELVAECGSRAGATGDE
jgi:uncharacterized cupin superfamily protein